MAGRDVPWAAPGWDCPGWVAPAGACRLGRGRLAVGGGLLRRRDGLAPDPGRIDHVLLADPPPDPVPATVARSTPCSAASLRTSGVT